MKNKTEKMNLPLSQVYNEEDDICYVTFKTGEPSYCLEVDDVLIMELGIFTNLPTGFRILNFSKNRVESIEFRIRIFKKIKETLDKIHPPKLGDRETQVRKALEEVLSNR